MIATLIILILAVAGVYGMLSYSAGEIRIGLRTPPTEARPAPSPSFRKIEKYVLYSLKHILQGIVLFSVKYWFIIVAKTKKFVMEKWPKIHDKFVKKEDRPDKPISATKVFFKRAVAESKFKIKRIKDKVKATHGPEEVPESGLENVSPSVKPDVEI
jgi:hypothetical protein